MTIASQKSSIPPSPHSATPNTHGARVPRAIAHRGNDQRHPENSLEAVQGAVRAGCDGIEMDLRVSRDGVVVLAHVGLAHQNITRPRG
jgi:phosphatidylglycerol phospholipase C